nr:riboflavin kinase [Candidatus Levybacteria bacterium]
MKTLFMFWGKVKKGKERGKLLGFPTANVTLHKKISEGIYASSVTIEEKTYFAATFIGSAKTFNEKDYKAESYILNFNKNIYGKWIGIKLFKKIRDNKKFKSEKELIIQMKQDILDIKKFFNKKST